MCVSTWWSGSWFLVGEDVIYVVKRGRRKHGSESD